MRCPRAYSDPDRARKLADLVHDSAKVISLLLWASIESNEAPIVHGEYLALVFNKVRLYDTTKGIFIIHVS